MKKILALSLICLVFLFYNVAQAKSSDSHGKVSSYVGEGIYTDNAGSYYKDADLTHRIVQIYAISDGGLIPVSIEDYLRFETDNMNSNMLDSQVDDPQIQSEYDYFTWYEEQSNYEFRPASQRATSDKENKTYSPMDWTWSTSHSTSHFFSVSLNTSEKKAIRGGVSYTWASSATTQESLTVTIQPWHKAWLEWAPKMRRSSGYVYTEWLHYGEITSKWVRTEYPVKTVFGSLDGWLTALEAPLN